MFQGLEETGQVLSKLGSLTLQAACSLSSPRGTTPADPQPKRSFLQKSCISHCTSACLTHNYSGQYLQVSALRSHSLCIIAVCDCVCLCQYVSVYPCQVSLSHLLCDMDHYFPALCSISRQMHPQRDLFNFGPLPPHLGQKSVKNVIYEKEVHL